MKRGMCLGIQMLYNSRTGKEGGEFPVELSLGTWRTEEGIFFTGIVRDITHRKREEEERERMIRELQDALANITILRGMSPICAFCKKIQDDKGYWNQMEAYIRDHSQGESIHGVCPDCMKKLYPDFAEDGKYQCSSIRELHLLEK